jgi:hypothetical protein
MLVGYNTNISYKDNIYHIQTEDRGQDNPIIVTLLYSKGKILASQKTNYAHIAGETDYKEKIRRLMKEQHDNMIRELLSGRCTVTDTEKEVSIQTVKQRREDLKK